MCRAHKRRTLSFGGDARRRPNDQTRAMYESFFGLTGPPFRLNPDPSFLFTGKGHRDAFAALRVGLTAGARVMVLTGEPGAGKTTLLQALLADIEPTSTATAQVSAAHLDAGTLSEQLCEAMA